VVWIVWLDFVLRPDNQTQVGARRIAQLFYRKTIEYSQFDCIVPDYIFDYSLLSYWDTSQILLF
jgi:hypothetical protein